MKSVLAYRGDILTGCASVGPDFQPPAAAEAVLRQAQQAYAVQAGSTLYPVVNLNLSASRSGTNPVGAGQTGSQETLYNLYNAVPAMYMMLGTEHREARREAEN